MGCSKASAPPSSPGVLESFLLLWPLPVHGHPLFTTALALRVNLSAHGRVPLDIRVLPQTTLITNSVRSPRATLGCSCSLSEQALSLTHPWLPREGGHCATSWMSGAETGPRPEPCHADCGPVKNGPCVCSVAWSSLVVGSGLVGSERVLCFCFFGESASFRRSAKYDCGSPAEAAVGSSRKSQVLPGPRGSPQGWRCPASPVLSIHVPTHPALLTLSCSSAPRWMSVSCASVQLLPLPASWYCQAPGSFCLSPAG